MHNWNYHPTFELELMNGLKGKESARREEGGGWGRYYPIFGDGDGWMDGWEPYRDQGSGRGGRDLPDRSVGACKAGE